MVGMYTIRPFLFLLLRLLFLYKNHHTYSWQVRNCWPALLLCLVGTYCPRGVFPTSALPMPSVARA
jgi:hypothetical protein